MKRYVTGYLSVEASIEGAVPIVSFPVPAFNNRFPLQTSAFNMHLQWFAAEDEGRTEEPTEYKIKKAREEGKVAKSSEFTSALVLLFPIIAIAILSSYLLHTIIDMMQYFLLISTETEIPGDGTIVTAFFSYFVRLTWPIFVIAVVSAVVGNLFQVGFLFTVKPLKPDLKRITPNVTRFLKRAFFSGEALFNLAKSLVKIIIIGAIAYINIHMEIDKFVHFISTPFWLNFSTIAQVAFRIIVESALAMLVLAIPDYLFQRKQHRESLKMTRHEVKEERKMHEGDPLVQNRLRERMREILAANMMRNVPEADVVITNPTHYAVAMKWDQAVMSAPMVTAKGQDNIAARIREIAQENEVPLIENKPLARALFAEVEIGDVVPEKYWEVVALVLAEVYKMTGRSAEAV